LVVNRGVDYNLVANKVISYILVLDRADRSCFDPLADHSYIGIIAKDKARHLI
jgi:hypothetical protein